jgi:hypothetical protein
MGTEKDRGLRPLMTGHLYPCDGSAGCLFRVYTTRPGHVSVFLDSPYQDGGLVDNVIEMPLADLGPWLEGRADY